MRSGSLVAAVLAIVAVVIAAGVCLVFPLTSNPGPESAQVLAIVGGVALCVSRAARCARRSQEGFAADALRGLVVAGAMLAIFILATTIGSLLSPSCGSQKGYLPFFFLAVPVLVLQTAIGTWIGRITGRTGIAIILAFVVEAAVGAWLFAGWYRAPSFQVASHLFVVLSGDLLRGADMPAVLIGYRFGTLMFGTALILLGSARFPRIRRQGLSTQTVSGAALYAMGAFAVVVGTVAHALTLDEIAPPRAKMEQRYSLEKRRGPLVVHADPVAVRPKDVDALLAEGNLWLDRLATRIGQKPQGDIHVWVHATRDEMARWTGAQHVDFTLPWRREIHIVGAEVPHETLGHELAHAVAGELSDSVLKIPSDLVVFSHAAVVEGMAVALTPELAMRDGLTVKEQAAAMKRVGLAPSTSTLFSGVSFFAESPARAYVAAGAFVESLAAKNAADPTSALAALYRRGKLDDATGSPDATAALIASHDAMLDALPLPPDAALVASERFERPSILRDVCAPEDAERARSLRARLRSGDATILDDESLLGSGQGEAPSRATLEDLLADAVEVEDEPTAVAVASRIASLHKDVDEAARTEELGDTMWRADRRRDAIAAWDRAKAEALPIDAQRLLLAKRLLADDVVRTGDQAPAAHAALDVLLATTTPKRAEAFERLHYHLGVDDGAPAEHKSEPRDGVAMARYIHARRLVQVGALVDGARQFRRVLEEGALPKPFLEQAQLALATALTKMGDAAEASDLLIAAADAAERPASRLLFRDRAERAARAAHAPERPERVTAQSDPAWADRLLLGVDDDGGL
jgi:hypothetical protein